MRSSYYRFPKEMPLRERALAYLRDIQEREDIEDVEEYLANASDEELDEDYPFEIECSISMAKKLLKRYGGDAFTQHFERDGGLFETTPITLKGNNSRFKYNRHL